MGRNRQIGHQIGIKDFEKANKYFNGDSYIEKKAFEIAVYPTPVNSFETLQIISSEKVTEDIKIQLFDLSGKLLCEKLTSKNNEKEFSFDVCASNSGIYILIGIENGKRIFSKKIWVN